MSSSDGTMLHCRACATQNLDRQWSHAHCLLSTIASSTHGRPTTGLPWEQCSAALFVAYRAAVDLFPGDKGAVFDALMASLGYDINDNSTDTTTATGIGNVTCDA